MCRAVHAAMRDINGPAHLRHHLRHRHHRDHASRPASTPPRWTPSQLAAAACDPPEHCWCPHLQARLLRSNQCRWRPRRGWRARQAVRRPHRGGPNRHQVSCDWIGGGHSCEAVLHLQGLGLLLQRSRHRHRHPCVQAHVRRGVAWREPPQRRPRPPPQLLACPIATGPTAPPPQPHSACPTRPRGPATPAEPRCSRSGCAAGPCAHTIEPAATPAPPPLATHARDGQRARLREKGQFARPNTPGRCCIAR